MGLWWNSVISIKVYKVYIYKIYSVYIVMNCKRCGLEFKDRRNLVQHLKRKRECMAIESDISLLEQLEGKGIKCEMSNLNIY